MTDEELLEIIKEKFPEDEYKKYISKRELLDILKTIYEEGYEYGKYIYY